MHHGTNCCEAFGESVVPLQIKRALRRVLPWRHRRLTGIRVHYMDHLVGDGATFGQGFLLYLLNRACRSRPARLNGVRVRASLASRFSGRVSQRRSVLRTSILKLSTPASVQLRTMHWPRALTCTNPIIWQTFLNPNNGTLLLAIRRGSQPSTPGDRLLI